MKTKQNFSISWKENKKIDKYKKIKLIIQSFLYGGVTGNIPAKYF